MTLNNLSTMLNGLIDTFGGEVVVIFDTKNVGDSSEPSHIIEVSIDVNPYTGVADQVTFKLGND